MRYLIKDKITVREVRNKNTFVTVERKHLWLYCALCKVSTASSVGVEWAVCCEWTASLFWSLISTAYSRHVLVLIMPGTDVLLYLYTHCCYWLLVSWALLCWFFASDSLIYSSPQSLSSYVFWQSWSVWMLWWEHRQTYKKRPKISLFVKEVFSVTARANAACLLQVYGASTVLCCTVIVLDSCDWQDMSESGGSDVPQITGALSFV